MPQKKKLSREQELAVIAVYEGGKSLAAVGLQFGVSGTTVRRILKDHDVPRRAHRLRGSVVRALSETEKAYIAGILDGEGSLIISNKKGRRQAHQPTIEISQAGPELAAYLCDKVGTCCVFVRKRRKYNPRWKDAHSWFLTGYKNIIDFLEQLYPYLLIKRKHAEVMIEYCHSRIHNLLERPIAPGRKCPVTDAELELIRTLRKLNA